MGEQLCYVDDLIIPVILKIFICYFRQTFFNIAFGERSYVAESRITNLEYKNSHVYCEEKKQCAHAELQSKIDISSKLLY